MIPNFYNSSSPFPADLSEDQNQQPMIFTQNYLQASSSSSLPYHDPLFDSTLDHGGNYFAHIQHIDQHEATKLALYGGSYEFENENENEKESTRLKLSFRKKEGSKCGYEIDNNSIKWMSSKMRLMQKMKNSDRTTTRVMEVPKVEDHHDDQKQQPSSDPMDTDYSSNNSSNNSNSTPVRVCSDCNTTKTPLWRSGPTGPKSLCNACGIRQRKARRAMAAAAAAAANGTVVESEASTVVKTNKAQHKNKRSNNGGGQVGQYKKRSKLVATPPPEKMEKKKNPCFEDLLMNLSKNLAFHRVFPQDEKEAAILLMALSSGLVHG